MIKNKFIAFAFVIVWSSLSTAVRSECNFATGNRISELNNPKAIQRIVIEIPKSRQFQKNFLKILVSRSENIPPKLKKNFKANVTVVYKFGGKCIYRGRVRQNGDWKDHLIVAPNGQPIRSLDVKLKNGNILNAVKFKLLIPYTRNGKNEVLATVLLRAAGYIAPETFEVWTVVNGVWSLMLFQEDARKELLERLGRREGPVFEGDEELIWSYKNFKNWDLEKVSLARLVNRNWFLKGRSSQDIVLRSFSQIQDVYLRFAQNIDRFTSSGFVVLQRNQELFRKYFLDLLAMNGLHAAKVHNRKFYYNVYTESFEPIYYDGNIKFKLFSEEAFLEKQFQGLRAVLPLFENFKYDGITRRISSKENISQEFTKRTTLEARKAKEFVQKSLRKLRENEKRIQGFLEKESKRKRVVHPRKDPYLHFFKLWNKRDLNRLS